MVAVKGIILYIKIFIFRSIKVINKVKHFIEKNKLLNKKDKVLVALSGGPDSICLLHILYSLKDDMNWR